MASQHPIMQVRQEERLAKETKSNLSTTSEREIKKIFRKSFREQT